MVNEATKFNTPTTSVSWTIGDKRLPLNSSFEDLRGLNFVDVYQEIDPDLDPTPDPIVIGQKANENPFGWSISNGGVVSDDVNGKHAALGAFVAAVLADNDAVITPEIPAGYAVTSFGVLSSEDLVVVKLRIPGAVTGEIPSVDGTVPTVEMRASILIGDNVVSTQLFVRHNDLFNAETMARLGEGDDIWVAYLDMENVVGAVGETPLTLRLDNEASAPVGFDDVSADELLLAATRANGTLGLSQEMLSTEAISFTNVVYAPQGSASTDIEGGDLAQYFSYTLKGDRLDWSFDAPLGVLAELGFEDTALVTFDIEIKNEDEAVVSVSTITLTLTGQNEAPTAAGGSFTPLEDHVLEGTLVANDVDLGDELTFAVNTSPSKGKLTINEGTGAFVFEPYADAVGADSFVFSVTDEQGARTTATVSLEITAVNDAPVVVNASVANGSFELLKESSFGVYLGNYQFEDADGQKADMMLTFSGYSDHGTLDIDATFLTDNSLTYDANAGTVSGPKAGQQALMTSIGIISYTDTTGDDITLAFGVSDNGSTEGTNITTPLGEIALQIFTNPEAQAATTNGLEDLAINGQLAAIEEDGDEVTFALAPAGAPKFGTVEISETGEYTYTPNADYYGVDTFRFAATDGKVTSFATITINLINTADAPVVSNEEVLMNANSSRSGQLEGAATGSDPLVFALLDGGAPKNGTVTISDEGRYVYTPNQGFSGTDFFTFQGSSAGISNIAVGTVYVFADKNAPVVGGLKIKTIETSGDYLGYVIAVDPNGDRLTFSVEDEDGPTNGSFVMKADGSFVYTPNEGFTGIDSFFVSVSDGVNTTRRSLDINASGENIGGVLTGTVEADLLFGTTGDDIIAGLGSDDAEIGDVISAGDGNDEIRISGDDGVNATISGGFGKDTIVVDPVGGEADLTGAKFDGIEQFVGNDKGIRFDGDLDMSGIGVTTATGGIRGGDGDDNLSGGAIADVFDGGAGRNSFTLMGSVRDYIITPEGAGRAATIENKIGEIDTVTNVDELIFDDYTYYLDEQVNPPLAGNDTATLTVGETLIIDDLDLVSNDFNPVAGSTDGLAVSSVNGDGPLDAELDDANDVSISADTGFESFAKGETTTVAVDYEVESLSGDIGAGRINVTVQGVNDAPIGMADSNEAGSFEKISGNVLDNDSDVDNGAVLAVGGLEGGRELRDSFSGMSSEGAKVKLARDGSYTYDARGVFSDLEIGKTHEDSFTYTVIDEHGASATQTVTITVTGEEAPQLGTNEFEDHARGGSVVTEEAGLLSSELAAIGATITAVNDGQALEIHELVDGKVVVRSAFEVDGTTGGTFNLDADGGFRFDPGRDFDDLKDDQTRDTEIEFTIKQGNGTQLSGAARVIVYASGKAPLIETTLTPETAPEFKEQATVGSFDQKQGVDVIGELFERFDDAIPFDLDSLLDFEVVDINAIFKASFSRKDGINLSVEDVSKNSDALISNLGEKLNPGAELVTDVVNTIYSLPPTPVYFGPSFDLEVGVQASLGWNIDLPSLGKTSVFQPVAFDLLIPEDKVNPGQAFLVNTGNFYSNAPTSVVQTVGLGDFKVDAGFAITSAKVSNMGIEFGTKDFLGLKVDDVFDGSIGLKHDIDLLESFGDMLGDGGAVGISLSLRDILDAVITMDFGEFQELVQAVIKDANKQTSGALADFIKDGLELIAANAAVRIDLGNGVELKPSDLINLADRIPFREFDGWTEAGDGYFVLTDGDGKDVNVSGSQIQAAIDNSNVGRAVEQVKTILSDGFEPIAGLKIFGELPIGNIETIEGFGDGLVTPQLGTQEIEVIQTTRLAGLSVNFEELAPEIAKIAIDKVTEGALQAAKAQPYLIPVVIGASIGARTALELAQEYQKTIEEGYTTKLKIQPFELVAAAINPLIEGLNAVAGVMNIVLGQIPFIGNSLQIPTIPTLTSEGLENAFDSVIDAMTDGISALLTGLANVAGDVLEFIADNDVFTTVVDLLGTMAGIGLGAAGDALSTIANAGDDLAKLVEINIDPIIGILGSAASVANSGAQAGYDLENTMSNLLRSASQLAAQGADKMASTLDDFGGFVKDMAKGVDMQISTKFDILDLALDAGIDLVQIARFNPDDVEVSYTIDGFESERQVVGDAAEFFASGDPGDILEGKAVYSFSGDVDYDYRIKLDIDPRLTLFGIDVEGDITLGEDNHHSIDFDYAGVKTTRDFTMDDIANLDPSNLFDDALVEIPLGFMEEFLEVVADSVRDGLGGFAGQTSDLDFNELRLFELKDVELTQDDFTQITTDFEIEIGQQRPLPHIDLNFDENTDFAVANANLLDGLEASMSRLEGSALNLGKLHEMIGGSFFVSTEGDVVYRDGTSNEHLNVGDTKEKVFEYHALNDDGSLSLLAARVVIHGVNDGPVAKADTTTIDEDSILTFDLLANDDDIDDNSVLTLTEVSAATGIATIEGNQLKYVPAADYFGEVKIDYTVEDEHGASSSSTLTLTITQVLDDLRAQDDDFDIMQSASKVFDVVSNDTEVDGEAIKIKAITEASKGSVEIGSATEVRFDAETDFDALKDGETEVVTVSVTLTDETGLDQISSLSFIVSGKNDAPVTMEITDTIDEDTTGTFDVLAGATDPDATDTVLLVSSANGANGTTAINLDGHVVYTPNKDFHGKDSFTYVVEDSLGAQTTGTVSVNITPRGEILRLGTTGDDVMEITSGNDGRTVIFDGNGGVDKVVAVNRKGHVDLTDAEFIEIETLDINYGVIRVKGDGLLDLSDVGEVVNSRGIFADGGDQLIIGTAKQDVISGGHGADTMLGGDGDDIFVLGKGEAMGDIIDGGAGFDIVRANFMSTSVDIEGATFKNIEQLDASGNYLKVDSKGVIDLSGVVEVVNTPGILGSQGADTIIGSGFDDTIEGQGGRDRLEGGEGSDTFLVTTNTTDGVQYIGGNGSDTLKLGSPSGTVNIDGAILDSVENIDGSGQALSFNGSFDLNSFDMIKDVAVFKGGRGNDALTSSHGGTVFDGGAGVDTMVLVGSIFDHQIVDNGTGAATIKLPGGAEIEVRNVETLQFDDHDWTLDGSGNGPLTEEDSAAVTVGEEVIVTAKDLMLNDRDLQDETFEVTSVKGDADGALEVTLDGTGVTIAASADVLASMDKDEVREIDVTYTVTSARGATSTETITVSVTGINDAPIANAEEKDVSEAEVVSGNVLTNDTDADANAVLQVSDLTGGVAEAGVFTATLSSGAVVTLLEDGTFGYDPAGAFDALQVGEEERDSFTYTVSDEHGETHEASVTLTIIGKNTAPIQDTITVDAEARSNVEVGAAEGLLAGATDVDNDDSEITLHNVTDGMVIEGSTGGVFTVNADGSYIFEAGRDFDTLAYGETRESSMDFEVRDIAGAVSTATLTVTVEGSNKAPTIEGDARFDSLVTQANWDAAEGNREVLSHSFDQLGSIDVMNELFERLDEATGFDINDLLDFTLIDINKLFEISSNGDTGVSIDVTDIDAPEGVAAGLVGDIISVGVDLASSAASVLPLDLGPIQVAPIFDAKIGLDIEFGWDVELPSLGRTTFFQPVGLDFEVEDHATAGSIFLVNSDNLVSETPTAVTETLGLGAVSVQAGFALPDTTVKNIGFDVRTSDFGEFKIGGLAQTSLTLNREFSLEETMEKAKELALYAVEQVAAVAGPSLPIDVSQLLDTILSLDIGNIISGLFNSDFDFQPILDLIPGGGSPQDMLPEILGMIQELSEKGGDISKNANVAGVMVSDRDVYDMAVNAKFNDFDAFDESGAGYFILKDDEGKEVQVTQEVVDFVASVRDVYSKVNKLQQVVEGFGLSPIEGAEVKFGLPVGNVTEVNEFGGDTEQTLTQNEDGTQSIELVQKTKLLSIDVDLQKVQLGLMKTVLDLVEEGATAGGGTPPPEVLALKAFIAFSEEIQIAAQEGIEVEMQLSPAALVTSTVNALYDGINLFGNGLDALVPGDVYTDIESIQQQDSLNALETALEVTTGGLSDAFKAIEPLIQIPVDIIRTALDVVGGAYDLIAGTAIDGITFVAGGVTSGISSAISALKSVQDFGISLPFGIENKPFKAILPAPIAVLEGMKTVIEAGVDAVNGLDSLVKDLRATVDDLLSLDLSDTFDSVLEAFNEKLMQLAEGADMMFSVGVTPFEVGFGADLTVTQIAKFDPNAVSVTYDFDNYEVETGVGSAVGFYAPDAEVGDVIDGTATYNLSGDVDYEYRLGVNIDPRLTLFGIDFAGELGIGRGDNRESLEFSAEYALAKSGESEAGNLLSHFDEALLELPFDYLDEQFDNLAGKIYDSLGIDLPFGGGVEDGELVLFKLDGVELTEDQFTELQQQFQIEIVEPELG